MVYLVGWPITTAGHQIRTELNNSTGDLTNDQDNDQADIRMGRDRSSG